MGLAYHTVSNSVKSPQVVRCQKLAPESAENRTRSVSQGLLDPRGVITCQVPFGWLH
jgi:hypothetical protein